MIAMQLDVWQVVSALSPLFAPVLSLFLVVLGRIIWNHEQRLRELERGSERQSRTIYGDERDAQQTGLAQDLNRLTDRVDQLDADINELRESIDQLHDE
jgi:septal ring factor EnvC (AmiA/AmiB activator)